MSIKTRLKKLPRNLNALRASHISYAQWGEDLFLAHLLRGDRGVFVDVGCFEPILYSNTYLFYQRGWRGLAIDPNPALKAKWTRFRPGDTFLNFAIASKPGKMALLINDRQASMNVVLDESALSKLKPAGQKAVSCEARPLGEILERNLKGTRIDLMNVDCEGMDIEVLETLDFRKYRPTVIAIEDSSISLDTRAASYMQALEYECRAYIGLTKIFQDKTQSDRWRNFNVEFPAALSESKPVST